MPLKDFYHDTFVTALKKDGWTITYDPLTVSVGKTDLLIDLGAERILAAERSGERIAVEIKSFIKPSLVLDLKEALWQYILSDGALLESPENKERWDFLFISDERRDLHIIAEQTHRRTSARP